MQVSVNDCRKKEEEKKKKKNKGPPQPVCEIIRTNFKQTNKANEQTNRQTNKNIYQCAKQHERKLQNNYELNIRKPGQGDSNVRNKTRKMEEEKRERMN